MDRDLKGWYTETCSMWPGEAFSLKVKHTLLQKRSKIQNIEIFESTNHGKVLVLDGAIQFTERDEASYQEMITFLPLNVHPNPKKVLVVGGGDGGVARELTKHPAVEAVVQCEIDDELSIKHQCVSGRGRGKIRHGVIEACKTHVPSMGCGFSNPKLTLHTGDGARFLEETEEKFDVIITDASDPVVNTDQEDGGTKDGPAASLFNEDYYIKMKDRLAEGGVLCCQGDNIWHDADLIVRLVTACRNIFPVAEYAFTSTPTYSAGQIGFILCSIDPNTKFREPVWVWDQKKATELGLKYYNADIHQAAFALPTFMLNRLTHND